MAYGFSQRITGAIKRLLPYQVKRWVKQIVIVFTGGRPKTLVKPHGQLQLSSLSEQQRISLIYDTPEQNLLVLLDGDGELPEKYQPFSKALMAQGYRTYHIKFVSNQDGYQVVRAMADNCFEVTLPLGDELALVKLCQDLKINCPLCLVLNDNWFAVAKKVPGHQLLGRRSSANVDMQLPENANDFVAMLEQALFPKVSVIVLTYNNLAYTQTCLNSLMQESHYPNLEIIIVDNQSTDGSVPYLKNYQQLFPQVKVVFNQENLGFAKGNNVGIAHAAGDYVVILNNDTCVTKGWVHGLLRHFRLQPKLGLLGPVTNNIDNEAKIAVQYADLHAMPAAANEYTSVHPHEMHQTTHISFFCTMIPMRIINELGMLSEEYSVGMFEDDDYCQQVMRAGYDIGIADDVFVHHHFSASIGKMKFAMQEDLLKRNKAVFEKKWGKWQDRRGRSRSC